MPYSFNPFTGRFDEVPGPVTTASPGLQPASGYDTITYASTVTIDFAARDKMMGTITLTGALTLATSNLADGREVRVRLVAGASSRALTFPVDWQFWSLKPATLPANKEAVLSLAAYGSTDASVRAVIVVQP